MTPTVEKHPWCAVHQTNHAYKAACRPANEPMDAKPPSLQELTEALAKWRKERTAPANSDYDPYGSDLRNQDNLLTSVLGMEQDIAFLSRYVQDLTEHIELVATDKESK